MRTILVVEDDPNMAEMVELALLRVPGVEVRCFPNVEQARARLASAEQFDVLITDVHLPGEDGLALVASVRAMPARCGLPVIVTTSSREPALRQRAEAMGVLLFLEKPWSAGRLCDTIHSLFNET
ncbi:MAG: response regulator [Bryobacteraceae bacterium]|nr:response regulator [Bryobacteraceae bacterium]